MRSAPSSVELTVVTKSSDALRRTKDLDYDFSEIDFLETKRNDIRLVLYWFQRMAALTLALSCVVIGICVSTLTNTEKLNKVLTVLLQSHTELLMAHTVLSLSLSLFACVCVCVFSLLSLCLSFPLSLCSCSLLANPPPLKKNCPIFQKMIPPSQSVLWQSTFFEVGVKELFSLFLG